jgi:hypothetical protein
MTSVRTITHIDEDDLGSIRKRCSVEKRAEARAPWRARPRRACSSTRPETNPCRRTRSYTDAWRLSCGAPLGAEPRAVARIATPAMIAPIGKTAATDLQQPASSVPNCAPSRRKTIALRRNTARSYTVRIRSRDAGLTATDRFCCMYNPPATTASTADYGSDSASAKQRMARRA